MLAQLQWQGLYPVNAQIQVDSHNLAIHRTTVLQGKTYDNFPGYEERMRLLQSHSDWDAKWIKKKTTTVGFAEQR